MKLENKVAVVTGATRGIGACMAQRFAAEGATVVVAGRNAERGDLVAKNIVEQGGKGTFVQTDIGVEADVQRLMARTADTFGGVDILVNNAAATSYTAATGYPPLADLATEDFDTVLKVGLYGLRYTLRKVTGSLLGRSTSGDDVDVGLRVGAGRKSPRTLG